MLTSRFQIPADKMQSLVILNNNGESKAALKKAKQFEKLYPQDPVLKNFIGVIYANIGNEDLAVKYFKRIIKTISMYFLIIFSCPKLYTYLPNWVIYNLSFKQLTQQ